MDIEAFMKSNDIISRKNLKEYSSSAELLSNVVFAKLN